MPSQCLANHRERSISAPLSKKTRRTDQSDSLGFKSDSLLERGSFHDGSMHGGNQPTNISLIHRRSSRLVPHHPVPLDPHRSPAPIDKSDHISVGEDFGRCLASVTTSNPAFPPLPTPLYAYFSLVVSRACAMSHLGKSMG
ncbi:conserved hypothetical protein [Thiomonas sp. X19]|nr:conserved hypothetical protein [Thiomonas sp. X19]